MAQISEEKRKDFLRQLNDIKSRLEDIQRQQSSSSKNSGLNAAQIGGAAGRGEDFSKLSEPQQQVLGDSISRATEAGVPMSELGTRTGNKDNPDETYLDNPRRFSSRPVPTLSRAQSERYVRSFGLEGLASSSMVAGKTASEANRILLAEKKRRMGMVNENTTGAFNPETMNRTRRAIDKFNFGLDEISNDPFEPQEAKLDNTNSAVDITSREIASLFTSPDQLYSQYEFNPQFREALDKFTEKGGSIDSIAKNISAPVTNQRKPGQTSAEYLAELQNPQANQEAQEIAMNELAPESRVAQEEIMRIAEIPDDLRTLYFGDEQTIGLLQQRQEQAKEEIRIIEEQEKDANRAARDRAQLQIRKNKAEARQQRAKIEQRRLEAKNYMTGRLAKLGALKTTGAAISAIQTIDTKYTQQLDTLDSNLRFANDAIELELNESMDEIENSVDMKILGIQEDLTNDAETVAKEILKAQQAAEKETYRITEQYARRLRERTSKYTADLKKAAEKYAKEYARTVGGGVETFIDAEEGAYVKTKDKEGVMLPNGEILSLDLTPTMASQVESANLYGAPTIRYFMNLPKSFRDKYSREAVSSGRNTNSVSELKEAFDQWTAEREADDEDEGDSDELY